MAGRRKAAAKGDLSTSQDEQFNAFLKASLGSDSDTSLSKYLQPKAAQKAEKPWWQSSVESSDDFDDNKAGTGLGLGTLTGSALLKKKPPIIPPISTLRSSLSETETTDHVSRPPRIAESLDSLAETETDSGLQQRTQSNVQPEFSANTAKKTFRSEEFRESMLSYEQTEPTETQTDGQETMDEQAEKSQFFKNLAAEADGTINYSLLNKQLDGTLVNVIEQPAQSSSDTPEAVKSLPFKHEQYQEQLYERSNKQTEEREIEADSLAQTTEHPGHTEQHEDDDDDEVLRPRTNLLDNVSLNDTLDTSLQGTSGPTNEGVIGSTTQLELEAVKEAYQRVQDIPPEGTLEYNPIDHPTSEPGEQLDTHRTEESQGTSVWDLQPAPEADKLSDGESVTPPVEGADTGAGLTGTGSDKTVRSSTPIQTVTPPNTNQQQPFDFTQRGKPHEYQSIHDLEPISPEPGLHPISTYIKHSDDEESEHQTRESRRRPTRESHRHEHRKSPSKHTKRKSPTRRAESVKRQTPQCLGATRTIVQSPDRGRKLSPHRPGSSKKYTHVKSSGYGVNTQKKFDLNSSRSEHSFTTSKKKKSDKSPERPDKSKTAINVTETSDLNLETSPVKLIQSVESFAQYLRGQFTASSPPQLTGEDSAIPTTVYKSLDSREIALHSELKEWQQKWREECRMREKISADFISADRNYKREIESNKLRYEQEIHSLKQQIYILEAKVSTQPPSEPADNRSGVTNIDITELQRQLAEQEKLIAGYQTENERLYKDIKHSEQVNKNIHDKLYTDNQQLTSELNNVRQQLERREVESRSRGVITAHEVQQQIAAGNAPRADLQNHKTYFAADLSGRQVSDHLIDGSPAALGAARIAELKNQLLQCKNDMLSSAAQVSSLATEKQDLKVKLSHMTAERDKLKHTVFTSKQPAEMKVIEERYQHEMNVLENRVRWYIDNQKLLDSDVNKMSNKDEQIKQLENQLKQQQLKTGQGYDNKQRMKDRAADSKRIKDLERQVREMETILRKRNPNGISTLIWAAAREPDLQVEKTPSMKYLEERNSELEEQLASKDEHTTRLLRNMQLQCDQAKVMYESRIQTLESDIQNIITDGKSTKLKHATVTGLDRELKTTRELSRKQLKEKDEQIELLQKQIESLQRKENVKTSSELRTLRKSQELSDIDKVQLTADLKSKQLEISQLHNAIDRLQKEKRQLLVELKHVQGQVETEVMEQSGKSNNAGGKTRVIKSHDIKSREVGGKTQIVKFSDDVHEREYTAEQFNSLHITDVLEQNKQLQIQLEQAQVELSEARVQFQKDLARVESEARDAQDTLMSKMRSIIESHSKEKNQLIEKYTSENKQIQLIEYRSKIEALERIIKHLNEDRKRWQTDSEELSALRIRNITLGNRIQSLQDELEDTKITQSPEMRHYNKLQDKLSKMEQRFTDRENELRKIINQNKMTYREDLDGEVFRWKQVASDKNIEIEHFRRELDYILNVLRDLQEQGVVLPL